MWVLWTELGQWARTAEGHRCSGWRYCQQDLVRGSRDVAEKRGCCCLEDHSFERRVGAYARKALEGYCWTWPLYCVGSMMLLGIRGRRVDTLCTATEGAKLYSQGRHFRQAKNTEMHLRRRSSILPLVCTTLLPREFVGGNSPSTIICSRCTRTHPATSSKDHTSLLP